MQSKGEIFEAIQIARKSNLILSLGSKKKIENLKQSIEFDSIRLQQTPDMNTAEDIYEDDFETYRQSSTLQQSDRKMFTDPSVIHLNDHQMIKSKSKDKFRTAAPSSPYK